MAMETMNSSLREVLDNEWLLVRDSGETPEIALHSALYYLIEDPDGPGLHLNDEQTRFLKQAAAERYREIILRDLQQSNRELSLYRGVKRSIINYHRFQSFCRRQQVDGGGFIPEIAAALLLFLATEAACATKGRREASINCSFLELNAFAMQIGLVKDTLPHELDRLCQDLKTGTERSEEQYKILVTP
jgi:hypothetical protein